MKDECQYNPDTGKVSICKAPIEINKILKGVLSACPIADRKFNTLTDYENYLNLLLRHITSGIQITITSGQEVAFQPRFVIQNVITGEEYINYSMSDIAPITDSNDFIYKVFSDAFDKIFLSGFAENTEYDYDKNRALNRKANNNSREQRSLVAVLNSNHLLVLYPFSKPSDIAVTYDQITTCWFDENDMSEQPKYVQELENIYSDGNIGLLEGIINVETNSRYGSFWFESNRNGFIQLSHCLSGTNNSQSWIDSNHRHYDVGSLSRDVEAFNVSNEYMFPRPLVSDFTDESK